MMTIENSVPCIITDIDGVLANGEHRQYLINGEKKNWDTFFELCHLDTPLKLTDFVREVSRNYVTYVWTSRPARVREKTIEWLNNLNLRWDSLAMRDDGDFRPAVDVKEEALQYFLQKHEPKDILMIIDDDVTITNMVYQKYGISALQVNSGYYD